MPKISDVLEKKKNDKKFVKKEYRSWDLGGDHSTLPSTENSNHEPQITKMSTDLIIRWDLKDRPSNEMGDIESLAKSFKDVGQQQPCIVRPSKEFSGKYELIAGERRFEAAKIANLNLQVVIKDLSDNEAALIQAVENEKRDSLSDYARGMSYADKIEKGIITQNDLTKILGISKQQVSRLLSFSKIPEPIFKAIEDFRLVSSKTAQEIVRLSKKGESYIELLIEISPKIKTGKYGYESINKYVQNKLKVARGRLEKQTDLNTKIVNNDGRHLFTWRLDNNSVPSIHFPRDIIKLSEDGKLNLDDLTEEIKKWLSERLSSLN